VDVCNVVTIKPNYRLTGINYNVFKHTIQTIRREFHITYSIANTSNHISQATKKYLSSIYIPNNGI